MTDHGDGDDRQAERKTGEPDDPATQPDPGNADAPEEGQDADD